VLTLALELDRPARDLLAPNKGGSCETKLVEEPMLLLEESDTVRLVDQFDDDDTFEEEAPKRRLLAARDRHSSCATWVKIPGIKCSGTYRFPGGQTMTLAAMCPTSCGSSSSSGNNERSQKERSQKERSQKERSQKERSQKEQKEKETQSKNEKKTKSNERQSKAGSGGSNSGGGNSGGTLTDHDEGNCPSWTKKYDCKGTTKYNFPGGMSMTLGQHCAKSCGPPPPPPPPPPPGATAGCNHEAANYVAAIVAGTSSIYSKNLGVTLKIQYMKVWDRDGAFNQGTDQGQRLNALKAAYKSANGFKKADIAHLFTGIRGGGLAYVGTACRTSGGYNTGVSSLQGGWRSQDNDNDNVQDSTSFNWDLIVTAHEMGHNVGSGHTFDTASYNPPIDRCYSDSGATRDKSKCVRGTVMSYCHLCATPSGKPRGEANVDMKLDDRVRAKIKAKLNGNCGFKL